MRLSSTLLYEKKTDLSRESDYLLQLRFSAPPHLSICIIIFYWKDNESLVVDFGNDDDDGGPLKK